MLTGALLDDVGGGLGHILAGLVLGVLVLLGVAVFVPVVILAGFIHQPAMLPAASAQPVITGSSADLAPAAHSQRASPALGGPVETARRYLGVRYVFGGSDPAIGLDCSGLVQLVYHQLGLPLPRTAQQQYNVTRRVERDQLQPGDLVFFARTYADP